jgi:hypothetical protein
MTFRVVMAAVGASGGNPIIADALVHSAGDVTWSRCDERAFYILTRALAAMPKMVGAAVKDATAEGEVVP